MPQPVAQDAADHLYVDMDTGTILNGPVYAVPAYLLKSEISDGKYQTWLSATASWLPRVLDQEP